MDQEKNVLDEVAEAAETVVEEVAEEVTEVIEAAEEVVEDAVETFEEKVRPQVYDDFSEEEAPVVETEEKKCSVNSGLVISTIISSAISVIVTLLVLFLMNAVPAWITASQVEGVWALDMTEYDMGHIYVVFDNGEMTLTGDQNGLMFTCDYDVTAKEKIELTADEENMMMVTNLIGGTELKVKYDKKADALTFAPAIGGVATWEAAEPEVAKSVIEGLDMPVEAPQFEDISGGAPVEAPDETPVQ